MAQRTEHMFELKSLGLVFSAGLVNEAFYKDFRNRREVAGYFGLAPGPWQSGGTDREQGISKAGNPRARKMAIELAWLWVRHQPDSTLTHRQCEPKDQAHRHCGLGTQADRGAVALSYDRPCARICSAQGRKGLNAPTNASASRQVPRSARDGW
jgi:Transposase IS116/IS110/IS902 family